MSIIIGKPINGISLNSLEYLMNDEGTSEKEFGNIKLAKGFLLDNGYEGWTDEELEDNFIFEEV
jgi:hypothetical protein